MLEAGIEREAARVLVDDLWQVLGASAAWVASAALTGEAPLLRAVASRPALGAGFWRALSDDPLLRMVLGGEEGHVVESVPDGGTRDSPFAAILRQERWEHAIVGATAETGRVRYVVGAARPLGDGRFDAEEQRLLACKIWDAGPALKTIASQSVAAMLGDALDRACAHTSSVVVLLDGSGRPLTVHGDLSAFVRPSLLEAAEDSTTGAIQLLPRRVVAAFKRAVRDRGAGEHHESLTHDGTLLELTVTPIRSGGAGSHVRYSAVICADGNGQGDHALGCPAGLSPREQEIVSCVAAGFGTDETADRLGISPWTVRTHLRNIYEKTGLRSRAALVAKAMQGALLDSPSG